MRNNVDDYAELALYLEDCDEEDPTVDLWVYTEPNKFFVINNVNRYPVRYKGWWSIPFIQYNRYATAHIEASKVTYFVTIGKDKVEYTSPKECSHTQTPDSWENGTPHCRECGIDMSSEYEMGN